MKKTVKKIFKVLGIVLGVILLALIAYIIYLYASYHRIEDNLVLEVEPAPDAGEDLEGLTSGARPASASALYNSSLTTGQEYSALTYNLGFGAYTPDFSFFMDGGKSSWAKSKESVQDTIQGAGELIASYDPDFALLQEVDLDSTRSYHVNEYSILKDCLSSYNSVFAQNYDSAFLFYPFTQPHGSSKSGLALFSRYQVTDSLRRSFPVSTSFSKFFDLDRCYSISRVPVDNGKELVIFELHMSAYGNSDAIREGQISMLAEDFQKIIFLPKDDLLRRVIRKKFLEAAAKTLQDIRKGTDGGGGEISLDLRDKPLGKLRPIRQFLLGQSVLRSQTFQFCSNIHKNSFEKTHENPDYQPCSR